MAGLGFKDFAVGEVLTSADVDGYLMQQTVMRFADAAARGSALGTAAGTGIPLAEGMVSYLDDIDQVQVYNGSIWTAAGRIVQVIQTVKTDTFSSTSTSFTDVTGLTVTITPATTSSRILLLGDVMIGGDDGNNYYQARLAGGNAGDYVGDAASSRTRALLNIRASFDDTGAGGEQNVGRWPFMYVDSPATTSATTYSVQVRRDAITAGTVYVNRQGADVDASYVVRGASSLIAIEVAA